MNADHTTSYCDIISLSLSLSLSPSCPLSRSQEFRSAAEARLALELADERSRLERVSDCKNAFVSLPTDRMPNGVCRSFVCLSWRSVVVATDLAAPLRLRMPWRFMCVEDVLRVACVRVCTCARVRVCACVRCVMAYAWQ